MKIVLASSNKNKVREINDIVKDSAIEFVLPEGDFDPEENGTTFKENSYIKARAAWELTKTWVLADDSGLCIDALGGKPGIYSARYDETPQKRIDKVLRELQDEENRKAHFECCMTLINPMGEVEAVFTGVCLGTIALSQSGENGFGYDPIFIVEDKNKTMAELSEAEKNLISHRALALKQILDYIKRRFI